jgi:hypothetical protein
MSWLAGGPGKVVMAPPVGSLDYSQLNPATTAALAGMRNRIINGCCRINQRPAIAVTQSNGSGLYGGPDHYQTFNTGPAANGQFTQSNTTMTVGGMTRPAIMQYVNSPVVNFSGANVWGGFTSRVEGFDCFDMIGQPATLSFLFYTNVGGTYSVSIADGAGSNSHVSTFIAVASQPQKVIIPIATLPLTLGTPISNAIGLSIFIGRLNTGQSTSVLNTWQPAIYVNSPAQVNWGATTGNFMVMSELQLEIGSIATPFERRPVSLELALCQRYYEQLGGVSQYDILFQGYGLAGTACSLTVPFKATKRIVPSYTKVGTWFVSNCAQPAVVGPLNVNSIILNTTVTATNVTQFNTVDATTYLTISAEM